MKTKQYIDLIEARWRLYSCVIGLLEQQFASVNPNHRQVSMNP